MHQEELVHCTAGQGALVETEVEKVYQSEILLKHCPLRPLFEHQTGR